MTFEQTREQFLIALNSNAYLNTCECSDMQNAISALEKQIPQKPKKNTNKVEKSNFYYVCPCCKEEFADIGGVYEVCGKQENPCYCPDCGQALDWSDTE